MAFERKEPGVMADTVPIGLHFDVPRVVSPLGGSSRRAHRLEPTTQRDRPLITIVGIGDGSAAPEWMLTSSA
jgi:hypothetical protein